MDGSPAAQGRAARHRLLKRTIDRLLPWFAGDHTITLRYPDGSETTVGNGPRVALEVKTWRALRQVALDPSLRFGEAYMDGQLVPLGCSIYDLLDAAVGTAVQKGLGPLSALRDRFGRISRRVNQLNLLSHSRRNVAHHYDFGLDLYRLMLDRDLQYSCGYFRHGNETLDAAQEAKKHHIARKLRLDRPGLRVLDMGCGWGGMALTLAREFGADVTGITLSHQQLETARERARSEGLSDRVRFELLDYRRVPRTFDRIVSVGMFEHVGINHYQHYFDVVRRCLETDGVALIHAIGRSHGPDATNPWLRKYIFPGGYSPALSEVLPSVERSGLIATDIEIWRLHYARTLASWRTNLLRHRDEIRARYDDRFVRMFEFYLAGSELAFRRAGHMVWQLQLARHQDVVPLSRDYMYADEAGRTPVPEPAGSDEWLPGGLRSGLAGGA